MLFVQRFAGALLTFSTYETRREQVSQFVSSVCLLPRQVYILQRQKEKEKTETT